LKESKEKNSSKQNQDGQKVEELKKEIESLNSQLKSKQTGMFVYFEIYFYFYFILFN